ncbi:hypothetical protein AB833_08530 [Chromatiales bacterium (ex Bugula neritina AB1)]|nr:hypothetical protein AB833_08530 [Chromatiales bacterium (ex Bugula neritina AB1)]
MFTTASVAPAISTFRLTLFFLFVLLTCAGLTCAGSSQLRAAETSGQPTAYPWSARGIAEHVEQKAFSGLLTTEQLAPLISAGESLFSARFTRDDGVGRPMSTQAIIPTKRKRPARHQFSRTAGLDANACSSCHNSPVVGGAGDFSVNVFVSEGFQNTDFDNTDPQFSNERNTNHLFGAGLIELLAREMTADLQLQRRQALASARKSGVKNTAELSSKGVLFGLLHAYPDGHVDHSDIEGIDPDLVIRPFSQKGVITSLRQFTINALNHHHGMLATERYGARWTGAIDFDEDGINNEITDGDVSALVAWQATLRSPLQLQPENEQWQSAAAAGNVRFNSIGCAQCHRPALPLKSAVFSDPGPYDAAGTRRQDDDNYAISYNLAQLQWAQSLPRNSDGHILVPLFGDLKRHKIADQEVATLGNELLSQRFVERDVFMTAELWGIASTAPYGHRGDLSTIDEVIRAHGGTARPARDRYIELPESEQQQLLAFLATLTLDDTKPVTQPHNVTDQKAVRQ